LPKLSKLTRVKTIKTIKGWRQLKHQGGYFNECTGQTLIVTKKQFSSNFHVLVFVGQQADEKDAKIVSPVFSAESKAEAYAIKLMTKHPDGIP
jgi:hypothetical protein